MRVPAVVHVGAPERSLDMPAPHIPEIVVALHNEVDQTHDLLEQKALDHGNDHRRRQVEEV